MGCKNVLSGEERGEDISSEGSSFRETRDI
jgi:hypothetical protein